MEVLSQTEILSVFEQTSILELIEFKWHEYAMDWHLKGLIFHFIYMGTITFFVMKLYV